MAKSMMGFNSTVVRKIKSKVRKKLGGSRPRRVTGDPKKTSRRKSMLGKLSNSKGFSRVKKVGPGKARSSTRTMKLKGHSGVVKKTRRRS